MKNQSFCETMKRYLRFSIPALLISLIIALTAIIVRASGYDDTDGLLLKLSIMMFLFSLFFLYVTLHIGTYKIIVEDDSIIIRSLFGKKVIRKADIISYTVKKYSPTSKYYIVEIAIESKKYKLSIMNIDKFKAVVPQCGIES